ncbi:xanthine/uracil permease [Anaeramoeba ignava]|uniref:Xanthine/uracil permease n=1 Tax=Anaeramoeba ignava TaxID=1746090 RepID=A0A9Q0LF30_ANAIG|nr:xanthine/uracil permease [Anaeramoeba ignava]
MSNQTLQDHLLTSTDSETIFEQTNDKNETLLKDLKENSNENLKESESNESDSSEFEKNQKRIKRQEIIQKRENLPFDKNQYTPKFYKPAEHNSPYSNKFFIFLDKTFYISQRRSDIKTEFIAGIVMYLATLYLIDVQPAHFAQFGMEENQVKVSMTIVTGLATIVTGFLTGIPVVVSCGICETNFFIDTLCGKFKYSWQSSLSLIFLQGAICLVLSFFIVRKSFVMAIPNSFRLGFAFGIGLFIGKVGVLGFVSISNEEIELEYQTLIGLFCLVLLAIGVYWDFRLMFIIAVLVSSIISLIISLTVDHEKLKWFPISLNDIAFKLKFKYKNASVISLLVISVINNLINTLSTSFTLIQFTYLQNLIFDTNTFLKLLIEKNGYLKKMLFTNAIFSMISPLLGTPATVPLIESVIGSAIGSRTGLSSVTTGLLFLITITFLPFTKIIPSEATGPLLLYSLVLLFSMVKYIDFGDLVDEIPIIVATLAIPVFNSIPYGFAVGYVSLVAFWIVGKKFKKLTFMMFIIGILSVATIVLPSINF